MGADNWMGRAAEKAAAAKSKAAEAAHTVAGGAGNTARSVAGGAGNAARSAAAFGSAKVSGLTDNLAPLVPARLAEIGAPTLPLDSDWSIGFGRFVGGMGGLPPQLGSLAHPLDLFGSMSISPQRIEFDSKVAAWRDITGVTMGSSTDALAAISADQVLRRLLAALPLIPGRKWLARQLVDTLVAICAAAQDAAAPGRPDALVPIAMTHGRLRRSQLHPGIFAVLISAEKPEVASAISELARQHSVTVSINPPSRAATRAVALGQFASRLRQRFDAVDQHEDLDEVEGFDPLEPAGEEPS
jgi:hypothetical protein